MERHSSSFSTRLLAGIFQNILGCMSYLRWAVHVYAQPTAEEDAVGIPLPVVGVQALLYPG